MEAALEMHPLSQGSCHAQRPSQVRHLGLGARGGRIRILDPKRLDDLLPWEWRTDRDADQRAA